MKVDIELTVGDYVEDMSTGVLYTYVRDGCATDYKFCNRKFPITVLRAGAKYALTECIDKEKVWIPRYDMK